MCEFLSSSIDTDRGTFYDHSILNEIENMKKFFAFTLLFLSVWSLRLYAAVDLELTQGIESALPIAIVPFRGQEGSLPQMNIADVVGADLQNSGRFRLTPFDERQHPSELREVDFDYWKESGANDLVIGSVEPAGGNAMQVAFQLIDPTDPTHVLINEQYRVESSQLRGLAHHISDLIYQKLTGERGVFSTQIAYIVNDKMAAQPYRLEVADADGFNPHVLLSSGEPIMSPAWSPDGKSIAYVSFENKRAQIYISNVQTGERRLITRYPGINGAPAWSPEGRTLAVVLSKGGAPKIYLVDLNSGNLTQVTDGLSIDTEPAFAPDGRSLVFTSDRGGTPQIYRLNLATRQIRRVTFDGNYNASASFTPNKEEIALLHRTNGRFLIGLQDLSSGVIALLTYSGDDESPSVAPNGKMVLYATRSLGRGMLAIVSTDGKVRLRLPAASGDVQEPAWSPFLE